MNRNNYNSLIKLANTVIPSTITPGSAEHQELIKRLNEMAMPSEKNMVIARSPEQETYYARESTAPEANSPINPATGGHRITMEPEGKFVGPLPTTHSMRQGELPLTPASSANYLSPMSLRDAQAQASAAQNAQTINQANKRKVAQNFDALFRDLHNVNQQRRQAGLPAYQPNMYDVYAPYASTNQEMAAAAHRADNDVSMSTITSEAARRGTPYNPAEINYMQRKMLPQNYQERSVRDQPFISPKAREFGVGDRRDEFRTFKANNYQLYKNL